MQNAVCAARAGSRMGLAATARAHAEGTVVLAASRTVGTRAGAARRHVDGGQRRALCGVAAHWARGHHITITGGLRVLLLLWETLWWGHLCQPIRMDLHCRKRGGFHGISVKRLHTTAIHPTAIHTQLWQHMPAHRCLVTWWELADHPFGRLQRISRRFDIRHIWGSTGAAAACSCRLLLFPGFMHRRKMH